jgi:uncharacterized membrane protein
VDKIALLESDLLTFLLAVSWCRTLLLAPVFLLLDRKIPGRMTSTIRTSIPVGILFAAEGFTHMAAISLGPVAYVVAVKRTSILFSALLGFYAFGEKKSVRIAGGVLLMVGGAIGLSLLSG